MTVSAYTSNKYNFFKTRLYIKVICEKKTGEQNFEVVKRNGDLMTPLGVECRKMTNRCSHT